MTCPTPKGSSTHARKRLPSYVLSLLITALAGLAVSAPAIASLAPARTAGRRQSRVVHSDCALKRGKKAGSGAARARRCAAGAHRSRAVRAQRQSPAAVEVTPISPAPLAAGGPPLGSTATGVAGTPAGTGAAPGASPAPRPSSKIGNSSPSAPEAGPDATLTDPIDPKYLTSIAFGQTSFWDQPWRAYLDTWPGSHLLESVGVNFNVSVADAEPAAQLLGEDGFKLARIAINWSDLSYTEPTSFRPAFIPIIRARLAALRNHGLRPLVVLDAYAGAPAPYKKLKLTTLAPASAGAQTVILSAASAAQVVPGKTGFNYLIFEGAPDELITSVGPGDVAHLARPLIRELPAGEHGGTTVLYAPFAPPTLPDGRPNPSFAATMAGWVTYVATVTKFLAAELGPGGFDLEVWNELTFGSQFLDSEFYYWPAGEDAAASPAVRPSVSARQKQLGTNSAAIRKAVLDETVSYVRSAQSGLSPAVGITDGFASETPFPSGAAAPPGLSALSKHPYASLRAYPEQYKSNGALPLSALGEADVTHKERPPFTPLFTPTFHLLSPEFMLTGVTAETLVRDVSPITTNVYGFPHGRNVAPAGQTPVQKWITEYNLPIPKAEKPALTPADVVHFHTKALMRSLVAMISKGFSREYMFAAAGGEMGIIGSEFLTDLEQHPGAYPGNQAGGEVLASLHNLLSRFQGPGPSATARQLQLLKISQEGDHSQFLGDGTAAHPTLYDREVLAVFPYQVSPTRFVIPAYVMSTNLLTLYEPDAPSSDVERYDMPAENFQITLGDLPETETPPTVSAYDPIRNVSTPAKLISREGSSATFEIAATDYPRLLTLEFPSS